MKCPHCLHGFHDQQLNHTLGWDGSPLVDDQAYVDVLHSVCPGCQRVTIHLRRRRQGAVGQGSVHMVWPKGVARLPLPIEVPEAFANDYREACLVFPDSPKASAALSRRCLQRLLRDQGKVTPGNLSSEIDQVMKTLPTYLAEAVDSVRNIGNFAAHPNKSTNTGEVIDVEPGEAEWLLETLEGLFDFYFVQPKRLTDKRAALNQKLGDAGQKPMK